MTTRTPKSDNFAWAQELFELEERAKRPERPSRKGELTNVTLTNLTIVEGDVVALDTLGHVVEGVERAWLVQSRELDPDALDPALSVINNEIMPEIRMARLDETNIVRLFTAVGDSFSDVYGVCLSKYGVNDTLRIVGLATTSRRRDSATTIGIQTLHAAATEWLRHSQDWSVVELDPHSGSRVFYESLGAVSSNDGSLTWCKSHITTFVERMDRILKEDDEPEEEVDNFVFVNDFEDTAYTEVELVDPPKEKRTEDEHRKIATRTDVGPIWKEGETIEPQPEQDVDDEPTQIEVLGTKQVVRVVRKEIERDEEGRISAIVETTTEGY